MSVCKVVATDHMCLPQVDAVNALQPMMVNTFGSAISDDTFYYLLNVAMDDQLFAPHAIHP